MKNCVNSSFDKVTRKWLLFRLEAKSQESILGLQKTGRPRSKTFISSRKINGLTKTRSHNVVNLK